MPTSSTVADGDAATAAQYNNLRTDVIATHFHDGTDGYDLFRFARKTANETVDGTTLQNDDHLLFTVVSGETWRFSCYLNITTTATADFKLTFTAPALTASQMIVVAQDSLGVGTFAGVQIGTIVSTIAIANSPTDMLVWVHGFVIPSASGTVQLQWAQQTDDGANLTTVLAGSWIEAVRVA